MPTRVAERIVMEGLRARNTELGRAIIFSPASQEEDTLLLCEVLIGKSWTVQRNHKDFWQLSGMSGNELRERGYDSVLASADKNHAEQLAIYNAGVIRPLYVIKFKM